MRAQENPLKRFESTSGVHWGSGDLFLQYIVQSFTLSLSSGYGTENLLSNLPGLINASSKASMLFVAASTKIPEAGSKPSSSFNKAVTILVFSVSIALPE